MHSHHFGSTRPFAAEREHRSLPQKAERNWFCMRPAALMRPEVVSSFQPPGTLLPVNAYSSFPLAHDSSKFSSPPRSPSQNPHLANRNQLRESKDQPDGMD